LRPDPAVVRDAEVISFMRAATAVAVAAIERQLSRPVCGPESSSSAAI